MLGSMLQARRRCLAIGATLLAVALAHLFFWQNGRHLVHDSWGYYVLSRAFAKGGLFHGCDATLLPPGCESFFRVRTYGYPLFLAFCSLLTTHDPVVLYFVVFETQLLIFLAASFYTSRSIQQTTEIPGFGCVLFCCTALNPWLLIHTSELLTDLLGAAVAFLAFGLLLRHGAGLPEKNGVPSALRGPHGPLSWAAVAAFFLAGFAVMLRPANLVLAPAFVLIWLLYAVLHGTNYLKVLPALLVAFAAPFVPQVVNNYHIKQELHPLVVDDLYERAATYGVRLIKYGSVDGGGPYKLVRWPNPFLPKNVSSPQEFRRRPLRYCLTGLTHAFALFDQSMPYTYPLSLFPWYRWPSSLLSFSFLGLCLYGVGVALGTTRCRHARDPLLFPALAALVVSAGYLIVYFPSSIEDRYAMPLYLFLSLFLVVALFRLAKLFGQARYGHLAVLAASLLVFLAGCAALSAWLASFAWVQVIS